MSNVIPMVSSTPPPLDDSGPAFDDWDDDDDDDFGGFTSAPNAIDHTDIPECPKSSAWLPESEPKEFPNGIVQESTAEKQPEQKEALPSTPAVLPNGPKPPADDDEKEQDEEWDAFSSSGNKVEGDTSEENVTDGPVNAQVAPPSTSSENLDIAPSTIKEPIPNLEQTDHTEGETPSPAVSAQTDVDDSSSPGDACQQTPSSANATSRNKPVVKDLPLVPSLGMEVYNEAGIDCETPDSTTQKEDDMFSPIPEDVTLYPAKSIHKRPIRGDTQETTSQESIVTDSGLCSDVSPCQKLDDYPMFSDPADVDAGFVESVQLAAAQTPTESNANQMDSTEGQPVDVITELSEQNIVSSRIEEESNTNNGVSIATSSLPKVSSSEGLQKPDSVSENRSTNGADGDEGESDSDFHFNSYRGEDDDDLCFKRPSFTEDEEAADAGGSKEGLKDDDYEGLYWEQPNEQQHSVQTPSDAGPDDVKNTKTGDDSDGHTSTNKTNDETARLESVTPVDKSSRDGDDDDDDDFGDFSSMTVSAAAVTNEQTEASGDGWAAFQSTGAPAAASDDGGWAAFQAPESGKTDDASDWPAFQSSEAQLKLEPTAADEEDDFGDFEDVKVSAPEPAKFQTMNLEERLSSSFPVPEEENNNQEDVKGLMSHMCEQQLRPVEESSTQGTQHSKSSKKKQDVAVWNNLSDLETTLGLKFHWLNSRTHQLLLQAISIDTRNILSVKKKQHVPIFAPNLGLLEPSRGPQEPKKAAASFETETTAVTDTTTPPVSAAPPTVTSPQVRSGNEIPAAEFDWTGSGLTNPLDYLENEFLSPVEPDKTLATRTLEPLENLMANMKLTTTSHPSVTKSGDSETWSRETEDILARLADLGFMQSYVLMFPLKGHTEDD